METSCWYYNVDGYVIIIIFVILCFQCCYDMLCMLYYDAVILPDYDMYYNNDKKTFMQEKIRHIIASFLYLILTYHNKIRDSTKIEKQPR